MRVLLFVLLGWLLGKLWQRFQTWRNHRKLVGQLKELGVYGGTVDTRKIPKKPVESIEISAEPDGPVPFGYKMGWLAAKCEDPCRLMEVLGLRDPKPANWTTGLAHAGYQGRVFVSPALDGYVLAVGLWAEDLKDVPGRTERLVDSFPEVQLFGTHRISDYHYWTKYVDGKVVRHDICQDAGVVWDEGGLTPEERALGFDRFPRAGQEDGGGRFPGEEDVLDIAAAWGVDPRFQKKTYPPSVGWVCD